MFITLYFTTYLSWPDWLYFYCFFRFEYFESFYHYSVFWFPLIVAIECSVYIHAGLW